MTVLGVQGQNPWSDLHGPPNTVSHAQQCGSTSTSSLRHVKNVFIDEVAMCLWVSHLTPLEQAASLQTEGQD